MPEAAQSQAGDKVPAPREVLANGQKKTVAGVEVEVLSDLVPRAS